MQRTQLQCLSLLSIVLSLVPVAAAAERRLAVLALQDQAELGDESATYLTDLVRQRALQWQVPDLAVITRENLVALLPPGSELAECLGDCEVETARRIGAELVVTGEVVRFHGGLRATLRLHASSSARLLAAETAQAADPGAMEQALQRATDALGSALVDTEPGPAVVYEPAKLPPVPPVEGAPDPAAANQSIGLSLRDVDVEALELYERALQVEEQADATSEARAEAWRDLAARPSAYRAVAEQRAAAWTRRAESERAAQSARAERRRLVEADWARIERLCRLRVVSTADKQRWLGEFIQAFGGDPEVRELVLKAQTLRSKLAEPRNQHAWLLLPDRVGQVVKLTMIGGAVRRGRLLGFDGVYAYLKRNAEVIKISAALIQRCE